MERPSQLQAWALTYSIFLNGVKIGSLADGEKLKSRRHFIGRRTERTHS